MKRCSILPAAVAALFSTFPLHAGVLYVSPTSPSPTPPFNSWATAAHTIQEAVDTAVAGETVLVGEGVYATGGRSEPIGTAQLNRVVIDKAIEVRSLNGPEVTVIRGGLAPAARCVWLGGGASLHGFTLTGGVVQGGRGGGARCMAGAILHNCVIRGNWSSGDGGGVYQGTVHHSTLADNVAKYTDGSDGDGGGADHSTLHNCILTGNRSRKGGGADNCTLYNCVLSNNTARRFGGGAARSKLYNCTLTGNTARFGGGAGGDGPGAECELYNCIAWHNEAPVGPNYYEAIIHHSCTFPLPASGIGNITADPRLSSWSHLSADSPCISAGSSAYGSGATDIDGQSWSNPPAMGADHYHPAATDLIPEVAMETDYARLATGYAARFKSAITGPVINSHWSFGDGTVVHNQLEVMHAWSAPGMYTVTLTAYEDAASSGITATRIIQVVERPVHYVDKANPSPVHPFTTLATAATSIQQAIGVSDVAGRLVLVAAGTYDTGGAVIEGSTRNRVALLHGVEVRSLGGPLVTTIRGAPSNTPGGPHGDEAYRCAYISHGSVLDGFTLTNGYTRSTGHTSREQGGGGAWCQRRGKVYRCLFSGNEAFRDGGGANGGSFYGCTFTGNSARGNGGAVDDAVLYDCLLIANSAGWGGCATESRLYSCSIAGHTVTPYSVGYACSLQNCIIYGNSASSENVLHSCHLLHCTLTGNSGSNYSGVVSHSDFVNCILYRNSPQSFPGCNFRHSCMTPLAPGTGNISADPGFVAHNLDNFRLRGDSPCMDAGTAAEIPVSVDYDGKPRLIDGNRDGMLRSDMGAFEYGAVLELNRSGSQGVLSWVSAPGEAFFVEQSSDLSAWSPLPGAATSPVFFDWTPAPRFFRLQRAPVPAGAPAPFLPLAAEE